MNLIHSSKNLLVCLVFKKRIF